jgi:hypothetical protein
MYLQLRNLPVFSRAFQVGKIHANSHVVTPTLLSNKKLLGIEHAHFEKKGEKSNLNTFWDRLMWIAKEGGLTVGTGTHFVVHIHAD